VVNHQQSFNDLDLCADRIIWSKCANAGQTCIAPDYILCNAKIYENFLLAAKSSLKRFYGDDPSKSPDLGRIISSTHVERLKSLLIDQEKNIVVGGNIDFATNYVEPTIIRDVSLSSPLMAEEIFGPIVSVVTFEDEADGIALANDSEFGLSGSIWTNNGAKALRVSRGIESGNLSVNSHSSVRYWTPFGGFKKSGLGRELGPDALNAFTEEKNVFINTEI
jgi:acyl-CoA reductase-like NAD-dependent aldehyde dehydrogenase